MATGVPGLPRDTAAWVGTSTGGRVVAARRLTGGIASSVHRCTVLSPGGAPTSVVLRRWTGVDPVRAMEVAERELGVLRQLEMTSIPAPVPLAVSDGRATDGSAALLMSRVPGHIDLAPLDTSSWVRQTAAALAAVHSLPFELPVPEPAARPSPDQVPAWAERPALWREALAVVQSPPADGARCFCHGDFQHFNLLWSRQRLTGVVDWTHPSTSSPDRDLAHCRLNLTVLYGHEMVEELRLAYEAEAGRRCDPWWDLHRLTGYTPDWQRFIPIQVSGRIPVDVAGMTRRVEEAMAGALRRL